MRELNEKEINEVNGGCITSGSLCDSISGALYGFGDGVATGIALGGSVTKSDGLGLGTIAQAVGACVGAVVGALWGTAAGFLYGKDEVAALCENYRETIN